MRRALEALERALRTPWAWLALGVVVVVADYATGPIVQFPAVLLAPVALAARYGSNATGIAAALVLPVIRALLMRTVAHPSLLASTINTGIHMAVFVTVAVLVRQAAQKRAALEEVRVLRGLLPICSYCKRIRNKAQDWDPLEKYVSEHSEATFTHGLCDACALEHYGIEPEQLRAPSAPPRDPSR